VKNSEKCVDPLEQRMWNMQIGQAMQDEALTHTVFRTS
jgi:hypothetical protein